jgi:hypothetical protein
MVCTAAVLRRDFPVALFTLFPLTQSSFSCVLTVESDGLAKYDNRGEIRCET